MNGEYYDSYWAERDHVRAGEVRNPHLLALIRSNIPPNSSVLDVGCGDGTSIAPVLRASDRLRRG